MSDDEKIWADRVHRLITSHNYARIPPLPVIDISVGYELGMTPDEVADSLLGRSAKGFDKIMEKMREKGTYGL